MMLPNDITDEPVTDAPLPTALAFTEGKFYRKASPGGWREDLTPEQVLVVEEITRPLIEQFYSE